MFTQFRTILWVQWRVQRNFSMRATRGSLIMTALAIVFWYGMWSLFALGAGLFVSGRVPMNVVRAIFPQSLFFLVFFWQMFPIMLASQGAVLDLRKLLVYPIPRRQLFVLEVALRISTAVEAIFLTFGIVIGLIFNPHLPWWAPVPILLLAIGNLLLSSGIKSLLDRFLKMPGVRELVVFLFLTVAFLPQILLATGVNRGTLQRLSVYLDAASLLPWAAAGSLALGNNALKYWASLAAAIALAYWFSRRQFERSLILDAAESSVRARATGKSRFAGLLSLPSRLFADPLAALIEREMRSLLRSPRFRLILLMSCTLGIVIWLPQAMRSGSSKPGFFSSNFHQITILYGMLLLGDVTFWNCFGFDRRSAQNWFIAPIRTVDVLVAKNTAAAVFVGVQFLISLLALRLLHFATTGYALLETLAGTLIFVLWMMAFGNLLSVSYPKPIDPAQSWRNSFAGGWQTVSRVLLIPLAAIPIVLSHLARWASGEESYYFLVAAVNLIIAMTFYWVALEKAAAIAQRDREKIINILTASDGPISIA